MPAKRGGASVTGQFRSQDLLHRKRTLPASKMGTIYIPQQPIPDYALPGRSYLAPRTWANPTTGQSIRLPTALQICQCS